MRHLKVAVALLLLGSMMMLCVGCAEFLQGVKTGSSQEQRDRMKRVDEDVQKLDEARKDVAAEIERLRAEGAALQDLVSLIAEQRKYEDEIRRLVEEGRAIAEEADDLDWKGIGGMIIGLIGSAASVYLHRRGSRYAKTVDVVLDGVESLDLDGEQKTSLARAQASGGVWPLVDSRLRKKGYSKKPS